MDIIDNLNVTVETAATTVVKSSWWNGKMTDQSIDRVWFLENGHAWLDDGNGRQRLTAGHLYIIPSHSLVEHGTTAKGATFHWCHLRTTLWHTPGGLAHLNIPLAQALTKVQQQAFTSHVAELGNTYANTMTDTATTIHDHIRRKRITWSLMEIILPRDISLKSNNQQQRQRLQPALSRMQQQLDQSLSMAELANLVHWDPAHFSTVFRQVIGITPLAYHHQLRCQKAKEHLLQTDLTLDAIAQVLGYTDGFHFSKTFKRVTGQTPKSFRQRRGVPAP